MICYEENPKDRDKWLAERRSGIGGSDCAAVLGISEWRRPLEVYAEKLGIGSERVETPAMRAGTILEPGLREMARQAIGFNFTIPRLCRHSKHEWMLGTPDALVDGESIGVELKLVGERMGRRFGESGDEVPESYLLQCHHYMTVLDYDKWILAAFFGATLEFRTYEIHRDKEMSEMLIEREGRFWHDHVLKKVPPPEADPMVVKDFLARKYPRNVEPLLKVESPEVIGMMQELARFREWLKCAKNDEEGAKNELKEIIGTAAGLEDGDGNKVTWKTTKDSKAVDWEAAFRRVANGMIPESSVNKIVESFTSTKPGVRRFLASGPMFKDE